MDWKDLKGMFENDQVFPVAKQLSKRFTKPERNPTYGLDSFPVFPGENWGSLLVLVSQGPRPVNSLLGLHISDKGSALSTPAPMSPHYAPSPTPTPILCTQ